MDYRLRQDIEKKLQGETGTIYKAARDKLAVALVYPNTYYVGMSNLGFQAIYGFLNAYDGVCCERAFLPDHEVLKLYEQTRTPLFTFESQRPLADFDIIAFSVSFENDYLNILKILELSGVPLKSEEREASDPYVMLGGGVTTINPEPLAMFFDIVVIGDGELVLERFVEIYQRWMNKGSKQELLEEVAKIPGMYVPSLYEVEYDNSGHIKRFASKQKAPETIEKCSLPELADYPAYSRILTEHTEFGAMFLLQINRGCPYKCRFCHTGYGNRPLRHLSLEVALRLVRHGLHYRNRIGLVGSAVADYPYLQEICQAISSQGGTLSVSSLRLSALSKSDMLLRVLVDTGQKTLAVAPEAGTERLRKIVRKPLSNSELYDTIECIVREYMPHLKLYFLVGLPTETSDDIDAIIEVGKTCRHIMLNAAKTQRTIGKLTMSVNPFVPKPFTPLQWCAMETESKLKRKIQRIKQAVSRLSYLEVIHELPKWAVWQGILARGDRKIGHVLLLTLQYQGDWKKAFRELNMHPGFYVHRNRSNNERFPWSHFNVGSSHHALLGEYHNLESER